MFVIFSGFQTKHTVFYHIVSADAVFSGKLVERDDQFDTAHLFAVKGYRHTVFKSDRDDFGLVRRVFESCRPVIDFFGGMIVRLFKAAAFDAA